jgi:protoporphyrinogen/coproporphyrinogen III oxidase
MAAAPSEATASPAASTVVVVGGGVAGLAAAWELVTGSREGSRPRVLVLESGARTGGKLRTEWFAGGPVDVGADGFLARRPEAVELCSEIGMSEELEPVGARGASVWARGKLRALPEGLVLGVPTRLAPLARSHILGPAAVARVGLDRVLPRPDIRSPIGDRAIGPLVAHKLGRRVVDVLVDPLVGGIHAGTTADMSAAAVFPMLLTAAQRRGSFTRSMRRVAEESASGESGPERPDKGPLFWALRDGMASLGDRLTASLTERGVDVRTETAVTELRRGGAHEPAWVLGTTGGPVRADGVVLAVPAPQAASLLTPHQDEAPRLLRAFEHASVTVVTLALPAGALPEGLHGTGLLVPRVARIPSSRLDEVLGAEKEGGGRRRRRRRDRSFMVTAVTYLSAKWPHLSRAHLPTDDGGEGGVVLLRASLGRWADHRVEELDDGALLGRVLAELGVLVGLRQRPLEVMVTRWADAFPQYRVHHPLRVSAIEAALARLPAIAVAGATYHGVGIPACIGSGRSAARAVRERLAASTNPASAGRSPPVG